MRKNLLLLIMFCLIATIGAKAEVTGKLSDDGTTFTITTGAEGGVNAYFDSNPDKLNNTKITTLVVVGPMKSEPDLSRLAYNMTGKIHIKTLDLTNAVFTSNQKIINWTNQESITAWDNLVFPCNGGNYLMSSLETIKFPKPATGTTMEIPANCMLRYKIKNVIIPCGYTTIGSSAFSECTNLQILNIPEGIKTIGSDAFSNSKIQAVRLPSTLTTIGDRAFNTCGGLASITIPASVTYIGTEAFRCCYDIRDVYVLATKAPKLGSGAFDQQTVEGCNGGYPADGTTKTDREAFWKDGHRWAVLHYPNDAYSTYRDDEIIKTFSVTGDDIMSYYPNDTEGKKLASAHPWQTDWKAFTLSKAIDGDIEPIPNIAASRWYTMCFDFDLTKDQIESAFGAGTEVCRFQGVKYTIDGNHNLTATLDFTKDMYDATTEASKKITEAGHPYMIHPAAATPDKNTAPIYYVMGIKTVADCQVYGDNGEVFDNGASPKGYYPQDSYKFIGNLGADTTVPAGNYYLGLPKDNHDGTEDGWRRYFYNTTATSNLPWKKYVATLQELGTVNYHAANPTAGAKTCVAFGNDAVIFTSDNSTTGIENTESENSNETSVKFADKVFSISGQLVRTGSSSLEGLAKGMYIVNGKKYIVK